MLNNWKLINFKNSVVAVSLPEETVIGCLANGFISSVSERWGTQSVANRPFQKRKMVLRCCSRLWKGPCSDTLGRTFVWSGL